ncbi:MAG: hypothetical protein ACLR2Q_04565, partial [Finegoldia magna]
TFDIVLETDNLNKILFDMFNDNFITIIDAKISGKYLIVCAVLVKEFLIISINESIILPTF